MTIMLITIEDQQQPIELWAADYGIPCSLIRSRLQRGWADERAVTEPMIVRRGEKLPLDALLDKAPAPRPIVPTPVVNLPPARRAVSKFDRAREAKARNYRRFAHDGLNLTIREWADRLGITIQAMHYRLKMNDGPEAFAPVGTHRRKRRKAGGASNTFEKSK